MATAVVGVVAAVAGGAAGTAAVGAGMTILGSTVLGGVIAGAVVGGVTSAAGYALMGKNPMDGLKAGLVTGAIGGGLAGWSAGASAAKAGADTAKTAAETTKAATTADVVKGGISDTNFVQPVAQDTTGTRLLESTVAKAPTQIYSEATPSLTSSLTNGASSLAANSGAADVMAINSPTHTTGLLSNITTPIKNVWNGLDKEGKGAVIKGGLKLGGDLISGQSKQDQQKAQQAWYNKQQAAQRARAGNMANVNLAQFRLPQITSFQSKYA